MRGWIWLAGRAAFARLLLRSASGSRRGIRAELADPSAGLRKADYNFEVRSLKD